MNWLLVIIGGLVSVIGLLYGYLERVKRKDAEERADTFFKSYVQEERNHGATVARFEKLVFHLKAEVQSLRDELDAATPPDKLRDRLNVILKWRVPPRAGSEADRGVPPSSTPDDGSGGG